MAEAVCKCPYRGERSRIDEVQLNFEKKKKNSLEVSGAWLEQLSSEESWEQFFSVLKVGWRVGESRIDEPGVTLPTIKLYPPNNQISYSSVSRTLHFVLS